MKMARRRRGSAAGLKLLLAAGLMLAAAGCGADQGSPSGQASPAGTVNAQPSADQQQGGSNPYEAAGIEDPAAFRNMFESLKEAVAHSDKEKAADHALFPILVNSGKVSVKIDSREEFIQQYDRIFTADVRRALAAQEADKLFVNAKGVMAGNGEVWFGATAETPQRYGIITINAGTGR